MKTEVQEPGAIKKLSVSVAVDWITPVDAKGKAGVPRALTAEERQNIESLVRAAVGFDQTRGDQVTVANVKFLRDAASEGGAVAKSPLAAFDKNDIMRAVELLIRPTNTVPSPRAVPAPCTLCTSISDSTAIQAVAIARTAIALGTVQTRRGISWGSPLISHLCVLR